MHEELESFMHLATRQSEVVLQLARSFSEECLACIRLTDQGAEV